MVIHILYMYNFVAINLMGFTFTGIIVKVMKTFKNTRVISETEEKFQKSPIQSCQCWELQSSNQSKL